MSRTLTWKARGGLALVACAALVATAAAAPAQAGSMSFYKSSGRMVDTSWLEVGELPGGVPGNIHFGWMLVEDLGQGNANVFGEVIDLTCPEGVIPEDPWGGGHGEEEPDNGCVHEGARWIEGGDVTFTLDRKLDEATLTGTLDVYGHDGSAGNPAANITWTGVGDTSSSTVAVRETYDGSTFQYRYSFTGREATVDGNIGAMIYDDADGEWSLAQMGSFRNMERSRTR
jgi:hypothetical protein